MAKFRYAVLENDVAKAAATTSGTETIDLPERGILSEVIPQVRHKSAYVDNTMLPDYLAVTKLELLVDGSTVVKSLTARQAMALMWYNKGPFSINNNYMSVGNVNVVYDAFPLYLGRFAGDTKCGLDLSQYSNPQLKITWDVSQTSVDGVTYDANTTDPTFTYNVMAKLIDGTPSGFQNQYVQSREINQYNPTGTGEDTTEIPRGYPLKGLMLGSRYVSIAWNAFFDHVKLDFDNGKWVPIDMDYENLAQAFKHWFPEPCIYNTWLKQADGDNFDQCMMQASSLSYAGAGSNVYHCLWGVFEFPIYTMSIYSHDGTQNTAATDIFYQVTGWGPMQTIYVPMGQLVTDGMDAIDTTEYGRIDLKIGTSGASTSAITRVVAEYLKPNGE